MGIGSSENPVMVEEPLSVPISGQLLCSEFGLESVPEQAEMPRPASDCQGLVGDGGYGCAGFGESRKTCSVDRAVSAGEHEDVGVLELEGLSKSESVSSGGDCLEEELRTEIKECCVGSDGECNEVKSEGEGGSRNLIGECDLSMEAVHVTSLATASALSESVVVDDACTRDLAGECSQEGKAEREGRSGDSIRGCETTLDVVPVAGLASGSSLNESIVDVDACTTEPARECKLEGKSEGEAELGNSMGDCESTVEVVPEANLASGLSLNESVVDVDACMRETTWECILENGMHSMESVGKPLEAIPMAGLANWHLLDDNHSGVEARDLLESRLPSEDGVGNSVGDGDLPRAVSPDVPLVGGDCLSESKGDVDACTMEKAWGCLLESGTQCCEDDDGNQTGNQVEPLEALHVPILASGGCLIENHCGRDIISAGKTEECLEETKAQDWGDVGIFSGDHDSTLEATNVVSLACGDRGLPKEVIITSSLASEIDDCGVKEAGLEDTMPADDGDARNQMASRGLMLEVTTVAELSVGDCLNENHSDQESSMECLAQSSSQGEQDAGNASRDCELPLEGTPIAGDGHLNENHSDTDTRAAEICEERLAGGDCLNEECRDTDATERGEQGGLVNSNGDYVFPVKLEVDHCFQDEQNNDKTIGCFLAEDVKEEAVENKDDSVAEVNSDFCDQEPLLNCESPESIPSNGVLGYSHLKKEQEFDSVDGLSLGIFGLESVASEAERLPLQPCDIDQNNCNDCPTNEIMEATVKVEANVDTSTQVSLATGLEGINRFETPSICVTEYEEIKTSVLIPSAKGVTEFAEEKSIATMDVEVGELVLPVEENPCTDNSPSKSSDIEGGSSKRLIFLDSCGSQDPIESTIPVDSFGQTGNQGKYNVGTNGISEEKCCEIVSSSSQRVNRRSRSKSNRKTQTKKSSRNAKNTAKALSPLRGVEILCKSGKKRSMSQTARLSSWGLLENVTQQFVQSNGLVDVVPVTNKRSHKSTGGDKKEEKKNKNGVLAREQGSKNRCSTSNTKIRLTVKMGKGLDQSPVNSMVPELGGKGEVSTLFKGLSSNPDLINDSRQRLATTKSAEDSRDNYFGVASKMLVEESRTESRSNDPGTSPDSEVINAIPDGHTDTRPHDATIHFVVALLAPPKNSTGPGVLSSNNRRGKRKNNLTGLGGSKSKSSQAARKSSAKSLKQYGRKQKSENGIYVDENIDSSVSANVSRDSLGDKEPSIVEPSHVSNETVVRLPTEVKEESGVEINCDLVSGFVLSNSEISKKFRSTAKTNDLKPSIATSQHSDSAMKKAKARDKGETQQQFVGKRGIDQKSVDDQLTYKVENQPEAVGVAENHEVADGGKNNAADGITSTEVPNLDLLPNAVGQQYIRPRNAWVRCDGCHKWRRIASELADLIEETQCSWTCKDNKDEAMADCSIPQEKSNSDINAELEISDGSGEEDAFGNRLHKKFESAGPIERQETVTCTTIRTNQFLHRNRRTQIIDEIMVCHCKAPSDGRLGCGNDCLNRVLNIECVPGACPCGELCSNQQFQKRKYAKLEKFHSGKKGYGLKLREDIPKGKFLIEYVGEVLEMQAYEARQKEYALKGHKHFYFMTLNGNEVIDACVKGNKGRYINHSCDPNCQTEKWMVNGEICIGLFALRDIKKGEEVTFDYNYVRVFGAAAKKCYCLSQQCRGYIGGDPLSGDVIIQSDSDEDYPKPRKRPPRDNAICRAKSSSVKQTAEGLPFALGQLETSTPLTQVVQGFNENTSPLVLLSENFQPKEDIANEPVSTVHEESSLAVETPVKSSSDNDYDDKSEKIVDRKHSSKTHSKVKTSRSPSSVKKSNGMSNAQDASKGHLAANKLPELSLQPKKVTEGSLGSRFEAVEEKLNVLLDKGGGLSRCKDSAKGYLKLLLLTSASGGTANSESIQRNRDLSMILDALLKTRSRLVLVDIINKNGLRMLHKIMKQYRGDFNKIPILRKLLKVLEYLAVRGILTEEHIKEGPPHPGMESFRESILSLTEHDDRKVHQIARNFRERWIPKNLRKSSFSDRDDFRADFPWSSRNNRYSPTWDNGSDHTGRHLEATRSDYGGRYSESTRFNYGERHSETTRSDRAERSSEVTRSDHRGRSSESSRSDHGGRSSESTRSDHGGRSSESTRFEHTGRHSEAAVNCVKQSAPEARVDTGIVNHVSASCVDVSQASGTRIRKRKSRWDQPAETVTDSSPPKEQKVEHKQQIESNPSPRMHEMPVDCTGLDKAGASHDGQTEVLEDFPPGFSAPLKPSDSLIAHPCTTLHPNCPSDVPFGHPPKKFISRLPVSYGIPLSIVQQFGTPHFEVTGSWFISPGMPFQPFPPLPSFPRVKKHPTPSSVSNQPAIERVQDMRSSNDCTPSTTSDQQPCGRIPTTEDSYSCKRGRESSYDLGTRYFKQQKWNHTKVQPQWHWTKNGWGCVENFGGETNNSNCNNVLGNVTNDIRSTSCSEDLSYQHQEHNTQH